MTFDVRAAAHLEPASSAGIVDYRESHRAMPVSQLRLSDLLGHAGRIWEHFAGWAKENPHGEPILKRTPQMRERFVAWKSADPLVGLPPPP